MINETFLKLNQLKNDFYSAVNLKSLEIKKIINVSEIALVAIVILTGILAIKSFSFTSSNLLIYVYTVGVTTFELSRISASLLYRKKVNGKSEDIEYEPKITFVIPCKNEEKVIFSTIQNCFNVNYPRSKIEVIAINDGSTDNTLYEMRRAKSVFNDLVIINFEKNEGKRHAMAAGFRRAAGEIIIQLDSDSYLEANSVRKLVEEFIDPQIGAVSVHTEPKNKDKNFLTKMQTAYYFMSFRVLKAAESVFDTVLCCSGCCSAYRKAYTLPLLGKWLDEKLFGKPITWGDDRALTNLMIKNNYKTIYSYDTQAYTIVPDTIKKFVKQQIRWKKGWFINSLKASKFILKKNPFVGLTYFFPLVFLTIITPFIAIKALLVNPIFLGINPIFYVSGIFLISTLLALHYIYFKKDKYWKYMFAWSIINMFAISYLMIYALLTLRNRGWGTR
jgi:hyaluronan synthase